MKAMFAAENRDAFAQAACAPSCYAEMNDSIMIILDTVLVSIFVALISSLLKLIGLLLEKVKVQTARIATHRMMSVPA